MACNSEKVNPNIGTVGHLLTATRPLIMLPHMPAQTWPLAAAPMQKDHYFCDKLRGFQLGSMEIMAGNGDYELTYDHYLEKAHPYYYFAETEDGLTFEATTTGHCFAFRFTGNSRVLLRLRPGTKTEEKGGLLFTEFQSKYIAPEYAAIKCSGDYTLERDGNNIILILPNPGAVVTAAISHISAEKAEALLGTEIGCKGFAQISAQSKEIWDEQLGMIEFEGGTPDTQAVYYTALYRTFMKMKDYAELGEYRGLDGKIYKGEHFYCDDNLWDTYRSAHPLQLLLEPDRQKRMMESYIEMYEQTGSLPLFPTTAGDRPCMIGFHAIACLADAMAKGIDIDAEKALEAALESTERESMLPWVCNTPPTEADRCYYEKGFFPALKPGEKETLKEAHSFERRQAVSVTLEHAYDDWCTAQIAKRAGRTDVYEKYMKRAKNYEKLYNSETGFMSPRSADGEWIEDFDPMYGGGQGGRDYFAECNAYCYTWSVFHDVEGLKQLIGGNDAMAKRLDELFVTDYNGKLKFEFNAQFPDETGLMGQFPMGNEPAFHIPYLYAYCGRPYRAQRRLREIMDIWFTNSPYGICGDEDGGAMSSWYAFSALGFYPVCPGTDMYILGTPMFDRIKITPRGGKPFEIIAEGAAEGKKYIQAAYLNGEKIDRVYLTHGEITAGGTLVLEMGPRPNKEFGAKGI